MVTMSKLWPVKMLSGR